jgi:hypothetical protein
MFHISAVLLAVNMSSSQVVISTANAAKLKMTFCRHVCLMFYGVKTEETGI